MRGLHSALQAGTVALVLACGGGSSELRGSGPAPRRLPDPAASAAREPSARGPASVAPVSSDPVSVHPGPGRRERAGADDLALGMNLRMVGPRNRELVFVDAMKSASQWRYLDELGARQGGPRARFARERRLRREAAPTVPTDEHGWPLPEPGRPIVCLLFADMDGHYPRGEYVCTWNGRGRIGFERAARVAEAGEHRAVVQVDPLLGDVLVRIDESDPEDPVRDVRLWMPGFEGAESPFHPLFLERLRHFRVLRFYPWGRPYSSKGVWSERTTRQSARQSGAQGVAVEYMVELANALGADPWFCMPHLADDDYVRRFAEYVRDALHPGATIWVEYSNEVWNGIFPQAEWVRAQGAERGERAMHVAGEEAARDFRIWHDVFGEHSGRIVRVASGQLHNPGIARTLVRGLDGNLDAIAVGAYFGVRAEREGLDRSTGAEELLAAARKNLRQLVLERIGEHADLATELSHELGRPISLVTYEGGQHLVARRSLGGADQSVVLDPRVVSQVQEMEGMYEAYRELLHGARERGVELFVAYDFVGERTPADTFGHLEFLKQPTSEAPKFRALIEPLSAADGEGRDAGPAGPADEDPDQPGGPGGG